MPEPMKTAIKEDAVFGVNELRFVGQESDPTPYDTTEKAIHIQTRHPRLVQLHRGQAIHAYDPIRPQRHPGQ